MSEENKVNDFSPIYALAKVTGPYQDDNTIHIFYFCLFPARLQEASQPG